MAVKTFSSNTTLSSSDVNTYLTNAGLVYVTEASATSGTTLTIDGCFTSTYDAYRVVLSNFRTAAAATSTTMVLRASGSDAATNYATGWAYQALFTSTGLTVNGSATGTAWDLVLLPNTSATGASFDIINPNLTQFTTFNSVGTYGVTTGGNGIKIVSGLHGTASAYDGFKITIAGTTITNVVARVYGYRQA